MKDITCVRVLQIIGVVYKCLLCSASIWFISVMSPFLSVRVFLSILCDLSVMQDKQDFFSQDYPDILGNYKWMNDV